MQQGIRLTAAVVLVSQGQERIQERAYEHAECQDHGPARQTIDIHMASFAFSPKTLSPAPQAEGTPERRWPGTAIGQDAPFDGRSVCVHVRRALSKDFRCGKSP